MCSENGNGRVPLVPVIGIDPGATGAISVITSTGELGVLPMPLCPKALSDILSDIRVNLGIKHAYIESLVKFIGYPQPSSAMAQYGYNTGLVNGILVANRYAVVQIPPRTWMPFYTEQLAKDLGRKAWKIHLASIARKLYPSVKISIPTADSVLIAHYAYIHINKEREGINQQEV